MNILVVNWQDITNPLSGGAEVHCHEIFSRIVRGGHRVTLCCSSYRGSVGRESIDGIEIRRFGSRPLFNFVFPFAYLACLRGGDYDVVVEDLNKVPFFSPLYVRRPLAGIAHHLFGKSRAYKFLAGQDLPYCEHQFIRCASLCKIAVCSGF